MHYRPTRKERAIAALLRPDEDETACHFVSSKGLMKLCETRQALPNDAKTTWPRKILRNHQPGGRIYLHVTAIKYFVNRVLHRIKSPFVLVSGDCVFDISPEKLGAENLNAILNHPNLIAWYTQNLKLQHPKLHPIPLGLDYHTMAWQRRPDWGPTASPRAQEDVLHSIRRLSKPLTDKKIIGHCNWHFALQNGDREDVIKVLPKASCFYEPTRLPRTDCYLNTTDHLFTISPRGMGMDCHRTWEAILLGSIPVIPDLPINTLFQTLPVVIVQDWSTVTPEFLARERERILEGTFNFAPVLLETWRRKLHQTGPAPDLKMPFQEFMELTPDDLTERCG